jgi:hypothetical protein
VDIGEQKDLSADRPADAQALTAATEEWNKQLLPPAFPGLGGRRGGAALKKQVEP